MSNATGFQAPKFIEQRRKYVFPDVGARNTASVKLTPKCVLYNFTKFLIQIVPPVFLVPLVLLVPLVPPVAKCIRLIVKRYYGGVSFCFLPSATAFLEREPQLCKERLLCLLPSAFLRVQSFLQPTYTQISN